MTNNTSTPDSSPEPPVVVSVAGRTGVLTLNRPKALNSLNREMIDIIAQALERWRDDADIDAVLIHSQHPKAFCAGGDVRAARENLAAGNTAGVDEFFVQEYALNAAISEYPKPYIAVIDGVVMGGGLGISAHGSVRVVTDKAFASMPEMAIGYVTDVGIGYAAQRMVGERGVASPQLAKFWALTGYRMYAADMLWSGVATHITDDAAAFTDAVVTHGFEVALAEHTRPAEQALAQPAPLAQWAEAIDDAFAPDTWPEIEARLAQYPELAEEVSGLMAKASPTAVVAALKLLALELDAPDIRAALAYEEAVGRYLRDYPDFSEGVRAVLVDKTQDAEFVPPTLDRIDEVDGAALDAALADLRS